MYWASLSNDIVFQAIQSPNEMKRKLNVAHWVEQPLLSGKSRMQRTGIDLQEIPVRLKFHALVAPFSDLRKAIQQAAANGTVLQWIYGTGEAIGDFVIIAAEEIKVWTDEAGLDIAIDMELTLKEYAGPGVAEQTGIDARQAAFANKQKSFADLPPAQPTTMRTVTQSLGTITESTAKIKAKTSKLQQGLIGFKKYKDEVVKACGQIQRAKNAADTAIQIAQNLRNSQTLSSALANVGLATSAVGTTVGSISGQASPTQITQIAGVVNDLSQATGSMGQASQPMQAAQGWWKVDPFLQ